MVVPIQPNILCVFGVMKENDNGNNKSGGEVMQRDKVTIKVSLSVPKERCVGDSPVNSCQFAGLREYGMCPIFNVECVRTDKPQECKDAEGDDG